MLARFFHGGRAVLGMVALAAAFAGCMQSSAGSQPESCRPDSIAAELAPLMAPGDRSVHRGWLEQDGTRFNVTEELAFHGVERVRVGGVSFEAWRWSDWRALTADGNGSLSSLTTWRDACGTLREEGWVAVHDERGRMSWNEEAECRDRAWEAGQAWGAPPAEGNAWQERCTMRITTRVSGDVLRGEEPYAWATRTLGRGNVTVAAGTFLAWHESDTLTAYGEGPDQTDAWWSEEACGWSVLHEGPGFQVELVDYGCGPEGRPNPPTVRFEGLALACAPEPCEAPGFVAHDGQ